MSELRATEYPTGSITIRVRDDDTSVVNGADVRIGFQVAASGYFGNEEVEVRGMTNASGEFTGAAKGDSDVGFTVQKSGYYKTVGKYSFKEPLGGKWQPWNPTVEIVLRKIQAPIAMYARLVHTEIPISGEPVGFDLQISDWVAPYGKGAVADLVFLLSREWHSAKDFDVHLTMRFSNLGDGVQLAEEALKYGSDLKLPRMAPDRGYEPELVTSISRKPAQPIRDEARDVRSYIYRVRTILNDDGRVVSALYGKIRGDIWLDPLNSKTAKLRFTYYLNPTPNDHGLEFDPQRNLLTDLNELEKPTAP